MQNFENKKTADLCAAPGGKTFQLLSNGANVTAFEKNYKRVKLMQQNLKRLKMKCKIINCDVLEKEFSEKFDMVVIDAPCSSVGTIRRNPEIFFKNKKFDLSIFIRLQKKLLEKAKSILNKKGEIIYMVCSFLNDEGIFQIKNFLNENKNFKMSKFSSQKFPDIEKFICKSGYFLTWPTILDNEVSFDGFFAAKLIKNA